MEALTVMKDKNKKSVANISLFESNGYHVIKRKSKFIIVKESDDSKEGYVPYNDKLYETAHGARKIINDFLTEEKYVIKQDAPEPSPDVNDGNDEIDVDVDSLDDEGMEPDTMDDGGEEVTAEQSENQELTGKLAYILRDDNDEIEDYNALVKYVFNTLIGSLKMDKVDTNLLDSIREKFNSESEDVTDEGGEDLDQDDAEAPVDENYLKEAASKKGYVFEKVMTIDQVLSGKFNTSDDFDDEDGLEEDLGSDIELEEGEYSLTDRKVDYDNRKKKDISYYTSDRFLDDDDYDPNLEDEDKEDYYYEDGE